MSVELAALPVDVLRMRMLAKVEECMDLDALAEVYQVLQIRRRKGKRKPKS
jgi:hypothetical protein